MNRPGEINNIGGNNWQHRPEHRQGVRYSNATCGRSSVTTIFVAEVRTGWISAAAAANRCSNRAAASNLGDRGGASGPGAGGGARSPVQGARVQTARRRATARRTAERGATACAADGPAEGNGRVRGLPAEAAAMLSGTSVRQSGPRPMRARSRKSQCSRRRRWRLARGGGGGGARAGGGGGFRGGGGGGGRGGGGGGGGRRSDIALKHDIALLGHLANGLGFYRFSYNGSERAYVGVMAQEVQTVMPEAVTRGQDGYLRVFYDKLGVKFQTYEQWIASGARVPAAVRVSH